jgi:hypothetical protein
MNGSTEAKVKLPVFVLSKIGFWWTKTAEKADLRGIKRRFKACICILSSGQSVRGEKPLGCLVFHRPNVAYLKKLPNHSQLLIVGGRKGKMSLNDLKKLALIIPKKFKITKNKNP